MKYQLASTDMFLAMALNAERRGYNRQLNVSKLNKVIDPDGTHVCKFSMLHEHIAGRKVDPHIRSIWMVKLKNKPSTEPFECALDIDLDVFNTLPVHDTKVNKV
jgi:hypothetical protein